MPKERVLPPSPSKILRKKNKVTDQHDAGALGTCPYIPNNSHKNGHENRLKKSSRKSSRKTSKNVEIVQKIVKKIGIKIVLTKIVYKNRQENR